MEFGKGNNRSLHSYSVMRADRHHINQEIKFDFTNDKLCWCHVLADMMWWEGHWSWENIFKNLNWGMFYGLRDSSLQSVKAMKNKESLRNCHGPEGTKETWQDNQMQCDILNCILEQKKDAGRKTGEKRRKYVVELIIQLISWFLKKGEAGWRVYWNSLYYFLWLFWNLKLFQKSSWNNNMAYHVYLWVFP